MEKIRFLHHQIRFLHTQTLLQARYQQQPSLHRQLPLSCLRLSIR